MRAELAGVRVTLQSIVSSLDGHDLDLDPDAAERLVDELATIERVAAAGKAIAARRVAESGRWRLRGARSEADWLARRTGQSVGAARATLETAARLEQLPATDAAFRSGALSDVQVGAVAAAASVVPERESQLLALAGQVALGKLRDECNRVRASGDDLEARHRRIHANRYWRTWLSADGAACGQYSLTPEAAAVLRAAAAPFVEGAFRAARSEGRHEPAEAHAADGLVAMAAAVRAGDVAVPVKQLAWPKGEAVLVVNVESLRRGAVGEGELCEIAGVGPVPVAVAQELLGESLLKVVIRDGVDIRTVVHAGRRPSALQRTAVLVRDGGRCVRPRCERPVAQIDHIDDYARTHHTTLDELAGLCHDDHQAKTIRGHRYRHGDRGWEWHHPDGTVEHERPP